MKKLIESIGLLVIAGLLISVGTAFANGGIAGRKLLQSYQPPMIAALMRAGSLKMDIEKLASQRGWKVVWNTDDDYNWERTVVIRARNFPELLQIVLSEYPLQANLYQGNKVLVMQPRTLK